MKKIILGVCIGFVLSVLGSIGYVVWPSFFPKFPIGTCVYDDQVHRVMKVTSTEDRLKSGKIAAIVLTNGDAMSGAFTKGAKVQLDPRDPHLLATPCSE